MPNLGNTSHGGRPGTRGTEPVALAFEGLGLECRSPPTRTDGGGGLRRCAQLDEVAEISQDVARIVVDRDSARIQQSLPACSAAE